MKTANTDTALAECADVVEKYLRDNGESRTRQISKDLREKFGRKFGDYAIRQSLKILLSDKRIVVRTRGAYINFFRIAGTPTPEQAAKAIDDQIAGGKFDPLSVQGNEMESGECDVAGGHSSASSLAKPIKTKFVPTRVVDPDALTPNTLKTIGGLISRGGGPAETNQIVDCCELRVSQVQQALYTLRSKKFVEVFPKDGNGRRLRGKTLTYTVTQAGRDAYAKATSTPPVDPATAPPEPSVDHLEFIGGNEYFVRGGTVYVCSSSTPLRSGTRFSGSRYCCLYSNWPAIRRQIERGKII